MVNGHRRQGKKNFALFECLVSDESLAQLTPSIADSSARCTTKTSTIFLAYSNQVCLLLLIHLFLFLFPLL